MWSLFEKIDQWLLRRVFEPFVREMEGAIGVTQWWAARGCLAVLVAEDAATAIAGRNGWDYAVLGIALVFAPVALALIARDERRQSRGEAANEWRYGFGMMALRMIQLSTGIVVAVSGVVSEWQPRDIGSVAMALFWFFVACDRLPPREKESQQMAPQT